MSKVMRPLGGSLYLAFPLNPYTWSPGSAEATSAHKLSLSEPRDLKSARGQRAKAPVSPFSYCTQWTGAGQSWAAGKVQEWGVPLGL